MIRSSKFLALLVIFMFGASFLCIAQLTAIPDSDGMWKYHCWDQTSGAWSAPNNLEDYEMKNEITMYYSPDTLINGVTYKKLRFRTVKTWAGIPDGKYRTP